MKFSVGKQDFSSEILANQVRKEVRVRLSPSEPRSLCSHLPFEGNFFLTGIRRVNADRAIGLLIVIATVNPWWSDLARLELSERAKKYQYQGKWFLVHKLCTLKFLELILISLFQSRDLNSRKVFGNYIQLGSEQFLKVKAVPNYLVRIKYPQRKRGYNDHGTRREESKWLPDRVWLGPNPEKKNLTSLTGNSKKAILNFLYD